MKQQPSYHQPLYKNCYYHIYNRAVGNDRLFFIEDNYYYFLKSFKKYLFPILDVYAYCLLPNHFHFLIQIKGEDPAFVSKQFKRFFIGYSMAINTQEKRKGNLFIKNFKRRWIKDESYLLSVVRYIHLNPIHHNFMADYKNYKFSSYKTILSSSKSTVKREDVLGWFGGKKEFIEFHEDGKDKIVEDFYNFEIA